MRTYQRGQWVPRFAAGQRLRLPDGKTDVELTGVDMDSELYEGTLDGRDRRFTEEFLEDSCRVLGREERR